MLRAPFHRTWRKIYENALVCFCFIHCLTPFPTHRPHPPPPPSWGIHHISRYIWFETDSALNNDLINSRNKNFKPLETPRQRHIHILWKRDARHDPSSSAAVAQRTYFFSSPLNYNEPRNTFMLLLFLKEINRRIDKDTLSRHISEQSQNMSALNPHIHFSLIYTLTSSSEGNSEIPKKLRKILNKFLWNILL